MFRIRHIDPFIRRENYRLIESWRLQPKFNLTDSEIIIKPNNVKSPADCILWGWPDDLITHMQEMYAELYGPSTTPSKKEIMYLLATETYMRAFPERQYKWYWNSHFTPNIPKYFPSYEWFTGLHGRLAVNANVVTSTMHKLWEEKLCLGTNVCVDEVKQRRKSNFSHTQTNIKKPVKHGHMIWTTAVPIDRERKLYLVVRLFVRSEKRKYSARERFVELLNIKHRQPTPLHVTADNNFESEEARTELEHAHIDYTISHNIHHDVVFWTAQKFDMALGEERILYRPKTDSSPARVAYTTNYAYLNSYWSTFFEDVGIVHDMSNLRPIPNLYAETHAYQDLWNELFYDGHFEHKHMSDGSAMLEFCRRLAETNGFEMFRYWNPDYKGTYRDFLEDAGIDMLCRFHV